MPIIRIYYSANNLSSVPSSYSTSRLVISMSMCRTADSSQHLGGGPRSLGSLSEAVRRHGRRAVDHGDGHVHESGSPVHESSRAVHHLWMAVDYAQLVVCWLVSSPFQCVHLLKQYRLWFYQQFLMSKQDNTLVHFIHHNINFDVNYVDFVFVTSGKLKN